jgi:hypothetical protein
MAEGSRGRARLWITLALIVFVLLFVVGPVVLHFGQKRHDVLPFDISAKYPPNQPIVPGEVYAATVVAIMEHELDGRTGWRPNDFFLWGPTLWADNNANRQLGIIQAVRESVRVFKDHLTKISSDDFDRNLVAADTAFRNDAEKFWLPSAESKFRDGIARLNAYIAGLKATPQTSRPINQRNVEAMRLFQAWTDLLGAAHGSLYRPSQGFFTTDDEFYRAQGFAHVLHYLGQAFEREYEHELETKPVLRTLLREAITALGKAATLKPLIVLDGGPEGIFANHRRNLDAYINEARQKMYSIREELEK